MDNNQKLTLLRAIAISSASSPIIIPFITQQSRAEAYSTLEEFKKCNEKIRVEVILELLQMERIQLPWDTSNRQQLQQQQAVMIDVTAATKLYMLSVLQAFLKTRYSQLYNEADRLALRNATLVAARQLLAQSSSSSQQPQQSQSQSQSQDTNMNMNENEIRFLAVKIASLLADICIRDFPQRWTTFVSDIFVSPEQGGLWYVATTTMMTETSSGKGYGTMIGVKICLECLKVITEDCTDGDFNSKISTTRRNDVLIGLNEVNHQFIPLLYDLLSTQYSTLCDAKNTLLEMQKYLVANSRTIRQMTIEEKSMYDTQVKIKTNAGRIIADCLRTIEKFCQSMPCDWMLPNTSSSPSANSDFLSALLHLLREDTAKLQVLSVRCFQQLLQRKLEMQDWLKIISLLPQAISEANAISNNEEMIRAAAEGNTNTKAENELDILVKKFTFHKTLSKMLAQAASGYVAYISDRSVIKERGQNHQVVLSFLNLLADMLAHPSGRICGEQSNTWAVLLRDPQIPKKSSQILQPCLGRVLSAFMTHLARIRWQDVEEMTHPMAALMEESWEDKSNYDIWIGDFRSKANFTMRLISSIDPKLAATIMHQKFKAVFTRYGNGEVRDFVDVSTGQLTQQSTAIMELEGLCQPLENILQGMPDWALDNSNTSDPSFMDPHRVEIRNAVRTLFGEIANILVAWNPVDCWLKFRRVTLLDPLKHYWKYDSATLASGIDVFLVYLGEGGELNDGPQSLRDDFTSLRKKSGVCLISVSKQVKHLLVPWLDQLSERVKELLSLSSLLSSVRMHLFEFLSTVATAVDDPMRRSNFIADVLSNALNVLESPSIREAIGSTDGLLSLMGVTQVANNPSLATNEEFVKQSTSNFDVLFSSLNQLLSVGKRCHEAARQRPNAGIPLSDNQLAAEVSQEHQQQNFPDEGPVSINDLSMNDPFVHLWPRIFPSVIQVLDISFTIWSPQVQGNILRDSIQRFIYAISDDEAYLAKNQSSLSGGGVFGEGGTAGSVVTGWDRRDCNLAPKWSGWFNELRHTCMQLLGLISGQRALFSPEIAGMYPRFVSVVANPDHLKAMEHRHMSQYIKQFMEYILLCCPSTLYQSHVAPIATQFFEHMEYRLKCTWAPVLAAGTSSDATKPLKNMDCNAAAEIALRGGEEWYTSFYSRGGAFVGDLDAVVGEAVVEKARVELSRSYADMLQTALALKGDWHLVLANLAREEQAQKKNDYTVLEKKPSSKMKPSSGPLNANGSKRSKFYKAIEARKIRRIDKLCHFLLLENETIAGYLVLSVAECLGYPDAYTCRRCIAISHRFLENVAWVERYTQLIGQQMFTNSVRMIIAEQKWLVGIEWDLINLIRDVYCRLVLGQYLQHGGQGSSNQQARDATGTRYEQTKAVDKPLQGGGILCIPSDLPRQVLASLPGLNPDMILQLENNLREKRSAKEQKEYLRDLLHTAAKHLQESEGTNQQAGVLGRANDSESLLSIRDKKDIVPSLPEKLVTHSMVIKQNQNTEEPSVSEYGALLFG